jgi:hypothetical protein
MRLRIKAFIETSEEPYDQFNKVIKRADARLDVYCGESVTPVASFEVERCDLERELGRKVKLGEEFVIGGES